MKYSHKAPSLRFRNFSAPWDPLKLDQVCSKIQDGTHFSPVQKQSGNFKYITSKNIRDGFMTLDDVLYVDDDAHKEIYKRCDVKYNDILLTKDGASTGNVCLNELHEEFSLLSSVAFLRADDSVASGAFVYQSLRGPRGQSQIKDSIAGQAITRITLTKLRNYTFNFPSLPEQQKIASFLSAVDTKIQQLKRKKELLEQYKKGVMQQLFSRKIRFKDEGGNEYPEWKERKLREVGDTFNGLTGKSGSDFGSGKKYIQYKQIFDTSKIDLTKCGYVQVADNEKQQMVKYGDVFFTTSSETPDEVGFSSVLLDSVDEVYLNSFCFGFRINSFDQLTPEFARYLFRSQEFRKSVVTLAQGSTRYNLSKTELLKTRILIPAKEEQQKIAAYLERLDNKILRIVDQLALTQTFKKGLLQQMFV